MTDQLTNEWTVLSYIVHEPEAFAWETAGLDDALFSRGETRSIASAIVALVRADEPITVEAIVRELSNAGIVLSEDALWNLAHGVGVCSGMDHYLGELVARRNRRVA